MSCTTVHWKILAALMISACVKGEQPDSAILQRIRDQAFSESAVMEHAFWLSEVYGPRLTGSPNFRGAGNWAEQQLRAYGIDVREESFPHFGDGWWCDRFEMSLVAPTFGAIYAAPVAWSNPTPGKVLGEAARVTMPWSAAEFDSFVAKYRGQLRNKLLLVDPPQPLPFVEEASGRRLSDNDLADLQRAQENPATGNGPGRAPGNAQQPPGAADRRPGWQELLFKFLHDEGVTALVSLAGPRGSINGNGIITVMAATFGPDNHPADVPPMIVTAREHYDRLARLVEHGVRTAVELDSSTHFRGQTSDAFNVIGEIRGNTKPEEIVMIGAHLDSWAGGTGATDDAAGCAVVMEAFRLLQGLGLKMDRTLRLALWGGEEMGLMGSSIYVKQHFPAGQPEPGHGKIVAYFNLDGGTGKIRGIEGTDAARTVLSQLLAPLRDLGAAAVSPRITRGSDHASFAAAGLPAYAFIQDPLDYSTRTHHTNMDLYDRLQPEDLKQAVAVVATLLYEMSNGDQSLPQHQAGEPR